MIRLAMKRAVRTTVPVLVTSVTSTTPRAAPGPGRIDLVGFRPVPGIDHDLDAVPLHGTPWDGTCVLRHTTRKHMGNQARAPAGRARAALLKRPAAGSLAREEEKARSVSRMPAGRLGKSAGPASGNHALVLDDRAVSDGGRRPRDYPGRRPPV